MTQDDQRVRDAIATLVTRVRHDMETHLEGFARELVQVAEHRDAHGAPDLKRAAVEVARAVAKGGDQARHDLISRLANAIRALDDATSLGATLEALGRGAAAESHRVAVLLVDEGTLRSWGHYGYAAGHGPVDLAVNASGVLAASVRLKQVNAVPPAGPRPDPGLPIFMRVVTGHLGQVMPLVVGDHVVAVVFAEGPDRQGEAAGPPVWSEQVEVLVRHAAARLENLTSRRAVEVLTATA